MFRTIVFDAFGTLFDTHSADSVYNLVFPGHGTKLRRLHRQIQHEHARILTLMGQHRNYEQIGSVALAAACRHLGLDANLALQSPLATIGANLAAFADTRSGLEQLNHAGYQLTILSNGTPRQLESLLKRSQLMLPMTLLSVELAGVYKPHPEAYQLVNDWFGVTNDEVLFVSAHEWDIAGAASHGFTCAWLNRQRKPVEGLMPSPWWQGQNMLELSADLISVSGQNPIDASR